jgi:hypothetical protein
VADHSTEVTAAMAVVELLSVRAFQSSAARLAYWYLKKGCDLFSRQAVAPLASIIAFTFFAIRPAAIATAGAAGIIAQWQITQALSACLPCFNYHAPSRFPLRRVQGVYGSPPLGSKCVVAFQIRESRTDPLPCREAGTPVGKPLGLPVNALSLGSRQMDRDVGVSLDQLPARCPGFRAVTS